MPNIKIENLEKNRTKITFILTKDEILPYLHEAATRLTTQSPIPGFRPGKASYDIAVERLGEMKILEEALETIIRKSYVQAVLEHDLQTVGSPKIDVEKMAPGNDLVFTAEMTRMPITLELADYSSLKIEAKKISVEDKDVELALRDLQRMQTKEMRAPKDTPVQKTDKVVISTNIKKDGVAIEGGQSPNHAIYLREEYYIPGFKDELIGLKEGDEKTFTLPFPKEHVQKMLAGQNVQFEIVVKEIYHLEPPAIDDAFAKSLGMKDVSALKEAITRNLQDEKNHEENLRQEREVLELVAKKSKFEEIPDLLLNEEINKMIAELKHAVEEQGAEFESYVANLKKTLSQLKMDFTPQALMRIRVALVMRAIAQKEAVNVTDQDIDTELDRLASHYEDKETKTHIYSPQNREYVEQILKNKKVIELLKGKIVISS